MTKPIGGEPPTPPGEPDRLKTLSQTFVKNLEVFINAMRTIKTNPHLADSKPALTDLANAIKTINGLTNLVKC